MVSEPRDMIDASNCSLLVVMIRTTALAAVVVLSRHFDVCVSGLVRRSCGRIDARDEDISFQGE